MNENIESVDPEKHKRIINSAYKEFALHGYKKASTNRIVQDAGIGKGMLFYYFESKINLFKYLVDYAIDFLNKYYSKLNDSENDSDYIEKYRLASQLKLAAYIENPNIFEFLIMLYYHEDEDKEEFAGELKDCLSKLNSVRDRYMTALYENKDASKFRKDISPERLIKYTRWIMDGFTKDILDKISFPLSMSDDEISSSWAEYDICLDDLKLLFYD